ncbi:MAG: BLUF domain-containing protein [Flavobacterium sp.]|nr:MAG: BLUF domain-containing protein [Flavobacterium sp.]
MVYYLLYYGVESFIFEQKDFEKLLEQSRQRNNLLDVTGKLIYCEGTFIQILEGPKQNVEAIYVSIKRDQRLAATKLISMGTVNERYFKDWTMDFEQISLKVIDELEKCTHPNVAAYITNAPAIRLLKLFNAK